LLSLAESKNSTVFTVSIQMIPLHDTSMEISSTQQEGSGRQKGREVIGRKEGRRSEGKVGRMLAGKEERRLPGKESSQQEREDVA